MSKRIGVKIIIGISFLVLAGVIASYFLADFMFNSAKKLEAGYLWKKAGDKYRLAINLDPFNAQYLAGYGDFLKNKSSYQENRANWLESAGKLYARALTMDSHNAEYALSFGQVELDLFSLDKHKFKDSLSHGVDALRRAIENDPNDADINYAAGYAAISVWDDLSAVDKQWVLDRLQLSLKAKPWYEEGIYSRLWQVTKDHIVLRKIRPVESVKDKQEKLKKIAKIKQGAIGQSWQGISRNGDTYEDGNMYWTGTVDRLADIPSGKVVLKIQAKGSPADDIWPYMIVELDGVEIGERFVDSPEWKDYSFQIDTDGGVKLLSVTFANDGGNSVKHEDRNLFVGDVWTLFSS